ncbi:MAG TPA: crosslink repair DNA glycosylase YcaQ family protein [Anaerolineaceae bacterium]|nr:crosslink repair DNA glycosylase YcaQ family protein [Anaerolineaceae bacterium]
MEMLSLEAIKEYRAQTFRTSAGLRLKSMAEAVGFINSCGFAFFWPNAERPLPSLWAAVAGDRPVPDEHDDPAHITWDWKDKALGQRLWYYGRVLAQRNAMISLALLPCFYALSPNYGDPENDYLEQYAAGQLTQEARLVYETLLKHGPLDTLMLRREAHLSSPESDHRFNRALNQLQMEYKVLPVGVAEVGAWRYAFVYELTNRHYPDLVSQAGAITEPEARRILLERYFKMVGAARLTDITRLFRWRPDDTARTLNKLVAVGELRCGLAVADQKGEWFADSALKIKPPDQLEA